ncbi:retrovirus-related Pol polyprotein from transposon 17.6 [Trichonephila clavipes]|nr:retrovirus-related Pol polyprotein from transposon 17.6 [Trichonephila clavipes]
MKDHFLDNWANLKSATQIAELFDNYKDVRKSDGVSREIQCDQGTSFTSALTAEFFERFGILVRHSSMYHPQSNPVERFHRTLKRLLRVLCLDAGSEWDKHLPSILLALRTVSHESTGYTPSELVYGKNLRTPETLVMEHWMEPEEEGDLVTEYTLASKS